MATSIDVVVFKFRTMYLTGNRWNRALFSGQKKKQNFDCLSNCRYCANRAQNLPRPTPNIWLAVFKISSKSVHCRLNYYQTREHRQIAHKVIPIFASKHQGLRGSASSVIGDWACRWERANSNPLRIDTVQLITKKM